MKFSRHSGFTLIEVIVAVTILSILLLSIFFVYTNIVHANRRLELLRVMRDNVRLVTETIASDVREHGIDFGHYGSLPAVYRPDFSGSGTTILAVGGDTRYFVVNALGSVCTGEMMRDPVQICSFAREHAGTIERLTGRRVDVRDIWFFISGDNLDDITNADYVPKVLISIELAVAADAGFSSGDTGISSLRVQTTINERPYQSSP